MGLAVKKVGMLTDSGDARDHKASAIAATCPASLPLLPQVVKWRRKAVERGQHRGDA